MFQKIDRPEDEWKALLTPEQFKVMRKKGTEPPFSGRYLLDEREGVYRCAACGNPLFWSATKYDSGTGWPSFSDALPGHIELGIHNPAGTEVMCARCSSHLGHVFSDGPKETGLRYCINSIALKLDPATKIKKDGSGELFEGDSVV